MGEVELVVEDCHGQFSCLPIRDFLGFVLVVIPGGDVIRIARCPDVDITVCPDVGKPNLIMKHLTGYTSLYFP